MRGIAKVIGRHFLPVIILSALSYYTASRLDLFETLSEFSAKHEHLELDEFIVVSIVLFYYFLIMNIRQRFILRQKNREINEALIEKKRPCS